MKSICKKSFIKNIQQKVAVVDTRSMQSFSKGFVRGSVFIGWNESFIKWLAYFVTKEKPFIIVVSKENVHEIVTTLEEYKFENCKGFITEERLNGSEICNNNCSTNETLELDFIDTCITEDVNNYTQIPGIVVVDVRTEEDNLQVKFKKNIHIPLSQLSNKISMFDKEKTYLLYCTDGYKSTIASSMLMANGINKVINVNGGIDMLQKQQIALSILTLN